MDEESQRKVVEGLTLLLQDFVERTNKAISNNDFNDTKFNIGSSKKIIGIIDAIDYFPAEEIVRLELFYDDAIKDAERVFVTEREGYECQKNRNELMNVLR